VKNAEFECRRCGNIASAKQYETSRFCPNCGTFLTPKPQPKHWLFQFNPSIYNWFDRIKETKQPEQWLVSQHFNLIKKGDLAAIWSSGQKAGIYALGQIITNPKKEPLNPAQQKYFLNKNDIHKFQEKPSVYLEYLNLYIKKPLLQEKCSQDTTLSDMQVLISPQGTNFRLTPKQWTRILSGLTGTDNENNIGT
jgi:hypothetical protein